MGMAFLCSLISGILAEKTWRAGSDLHDLDLELSRGFLPHVFGALTWIT